MKLAAFSVLAAAALLTACAAPSSSHHAAWGYTGNGAPVSPLGPPDKGYAINVGAKYAINKNVDVSAGVQYNWYKNQTVAVEGGGMVTPVAEFKNMNVLGAGVQLGVHF